MLDHLMLKYKIPLYENRTALREISEYLPVLALSLELFFAVLAIIIFIYAIIQFYKIQTFHLNLRILLIDTMLSYLIRTFSRAGICLYVATEIFNLDKIEQMKMYHYLDFGCMIGQYVCGTNMLLIFLERLYATKKALIYEHQITPIIMLISSLIIWIIVICFLFVIFYFEITLIAPVTTCAIMVLISTIGICYVLSLNRQLYKKRANLNKNLSFRYQVSENVRSFEILIPMLIMLIVGCVITMIVYLTIPMLTSIHSKALLGAIYNIIIVSGGVIVPSVMILSLQSYRDKFCAFVRRYCFCCSKNGNKNLRSKVVLLTLSEKQPDDVTNFYFKQISLMWN